VFEMIEFHDQKPPPQLSDPGKHRPAPSFIFLAMSGVLEERSATAVHATLAALVRANAAASSAWSDYESVFLDPATASFFEARLPDAKASESNPPSKKKKKKRKLDADSDSDESPAPIVCEHCGGPVPQVSLRVASLDGTALVVTVAQRGLVREVKRLVGQVRRGRVRQEGIANDSNYDLFLSCSRATWTRA
jgi:hypothetical protein